MLLVEDDASSASALTVILERQGYEVLFASTVAEAKNMLAREPATLILDLMLPDGDGASILREVRNSNLPIRVLVMTGVGDPARLQAVKVLNPELMLRKPIDLGTLLRAINPAN